MAVYYKRSYSKGFVFENKRVYRFIERILKGIVIDLKNRKFQFKL